MVFVGEFVVGVEDHGVYAVREASAVGVSVGHQRGVRGVSSSDQHTRLTSRHCSTNTTLAHSVASSYIYNNTPQIFVFDKISLHTLFISRKRCHKLGLF